MRGDFSIHAVSRHGRRDTVALDSATAAGGSNVACVWLFLVRRNVQSNYPPNRRLARVGVGVAHCCLGVGRLFRSLLTRWEMAINQVPSGLDTSGSLSRSCTGGSGPLKSCGWQPPRPNRTAIPWPLWAHSGSRHPWAVTGRAEPASTLETALE